MTDQPIISAENLHKEFTIHVKQATSLKEMVLKNLLKPGEVKQLHALNGVNFSLPQGKSLAIVGSNGSGKSTLLKIIAKITDPTSGTITANGRIAALLELGAGFEKEFTGMENIFLQCSIMGFSRQQILDRLGKILDFCELDKFIHTPVKCYSSGMQMRLGFAIAAYVDADILLLDEVMTVGDTAFQMKCMKKIKELRQQGKTILFVSHLLEHVEAMADQVLWLENGKVKAYGSADDILPLFYETLHDGHNVRSAESTEVEMDSRAKAALPTGRFAATRARMTSVKVLNKKDEETRSFHVEEKMIIRTEIEVMEPLDRLELSIALGTMDAIRATWIGSGSLMTNVKPGRYTLEVETEDYRLTPGRYLMSLMLGDPNDLTITYDLHLRLYAISLTNDDQRIIHDPTEGRLLALGEFGEK